MSHKDDTTDLSEKLRNAARRLIETAPPEPPDEPDPEGHPMAYNPADDPTMIEVRTPRYGVFSDGTPGGYNPGAKNFEALEGYDVSYRKREPGEEKFAFILLEATNRKDKEAPVTVQGETYQEWRNRVINEGASSLRRPPVSSYVQPRPESFWERNSRFAGWGRDSFGR